MRPLPLTAATYDRALALASAGGLLWRDALIVAAQEAGAVRLLSEDMHAGRRFGDLVVENPFA